ncbi:uncharacterized protein [Clytia hemisphaerica]|uniref:uncharacterized protein n=1 Tax=Clytia hemisphaerica TaxID=252671 RepID=UPI0034D67760
MAAKLEEFHADLQQAFHEARNNKELDFEKEYQTQQDLYEKYASDWNQLMIETEFKAPQILASIISDLYGKNNYVTILDYGCGTGPVASALVNLHGFPKMIDGLDPCLELLEIAKKNDRMRNYYSLGSTDDHSVLGLKNYDMVCSSGVFFATPSHPNLDCLPQLCDLAKKGGYIFICTGQIYMKIAQMEHAERLEREGKIKILPTEVFDGYRKATDLEEGQTIKGVVLKFQVLS